MSRYDAYATTQGTAFQNRGWIVSALLGSAVLHAGLLTFFYFKRVESFGQREVEVAKPVIQRVTISQAPKKEQEVTTAGVAEVSNRKKEIILPKEKIKLDELSIAPQHKSVDTSKLFANEKPAMEVAKLETRVTSVNPDAGLPKLDEKFFSDRTGPKVMARAAADPGPDGDGTSHAIGIAGKDVSGILDALNETPASGPKALSLPGNTTFGYDDDKLGAEGRDAMEKVAEVFKKFLGEDLMTSTFSITGHTDSFGTEAYNDHLSHRRAEAVRAWLVVNLGIDPQKIQTAGMGSRQMIVPAGTVEEQAPNRRVEIVIKRQKKQ